MNRVEFFKLAASSLILGSSVTTFGGSAVFASESAQPGKSAKAAAVAARNATKAMARQHFDKAIGFAEAAVAALPGSADYRALLGQAYLSAGRFQSAEMALTDAIALDPANPRTALNLALSQVALARNAKAMATLDAAKAVIPSADYGLALALAGDAEAAVVILEGAARGIEADAKTRQNLGLAYALANRWAQARAMAAQDLSPAMVDQRMTEWALFAHQAASWDQVASLLGVKPAYDTGMPIQLALNRAPATTTVAVAVSTVPDPEPATAPEPAPVVEVAAAPEPTPEPVFETPAVEAPRPAFVTAILPAPEPVAIPPEPALIRSEPAPIKQAVVPAFAAPTFKAVRVASFKDAVETGRFVVQLGAFSSEARANIAWKSAFGRTRELGDYAIGTPRVQVRGASLYRLSVSGFTSQATAHQVCAKVKVTGGQCFVRSISNGNPMQWANRGSTRIASRR